MAGEIKQLEGDEYQEATQAVVDDAMRTDVLGPRVVKILKEHTPAGDTIKDLIIKSLDDRKVEDAFGELTSRINRNRKGKWVERALWLFIGAIILLLLNLFKDLMIGK